ncbi:MAG TPA: hypothetical protein VH722_17150 [Alphaproteobacteria bacterium]|jgi:hypothetical protein|nr:hypothetical protein [Alphaproteobacteria bacterium]
MLVPEELARQNIAIFIEKHPFPRPGWTVSSRMGHHTVRVRELDAARTVGRRFDVTISHRNGTATALYERRGGDTMRVRKPQRMEWLMACVQRMRLIDAGRIGQRT